MRTRAQYRRLRLEPLEDRRLLDAGTLDSTFGTDGLVLTDFGGTESVAGAVQQPDGKVVVAGTAQFPSGSRAFVLARYLNDGSLDPSFGNRPALGNLFGRILHNETAGLPTLARAEDVALQADGKIVVVGTSRASGVVAYPQVTLVRYNADGTLDDGSSSDSTPGDSFGAAGLVTRQMHSAPIDLGGLTTGKAVALDAQGRLVVAVSFHNAFNWHQALLRYLPDGSPDTAFDLDGRLDFTLVGHSLPLVFEAPEDLGIQTDGKIIVAGNAQASSGAQFFTAIRFHPGGVFDTTFGDGGAVLINFDTSIASLASLAFHPDGDLMLGGYAPGSAASRTGNNFAAARLEIGSTLADGTLSPGFGSASLPGRILEDFRSTGSPFQRSEEFARAVAVQPDGMVLLAGSTVELSEFNPQVPPDFALLRLTTDGVRDSTFGTQGWVATDFGTANSPTTDEAQAILVTSDGLIVVAGTSNGNFALARYVSGPDDADGDGVRNAVEDGALNRDGNGDGVFDRDQPDVATLPNARDDQYVTLQTNRGLFREVQTIEPGQLLGDATRPVGNFAFRVEGLTPGVTAEVDFRLPAGATADTFFAFGPTADDRVDHWYQIVADSGAPAGVLRVTLTDGGPGDNDGLANGIIVATIAPARDEGSPDVHQITGRKFHDVDGDGVFDNFLGGEPGLAGWTIYLDENANGVLDAGEPWSLTDAGGGYAFFNDDALAPGAFVQEVRNGGLIAYVNLQRRSYIVAEVQQPGWVNTLPGPFQVLGTVMNPSAASTGDVDGDGDLDLVVRAVSTDPQEVAEVFVFHNHGGGYFTPGPRLLDVFTDDLVVRDFNGDGRADVVVTSSVLGISRARIYLANLLGGFEDGVQIYGDNVDEGEVLRAAAGNVIGDGSVDVVLVGNTTGKIHVLEGNGGGAFQNPRTFNFGFGEGIDELLLEDFTGDGRRDITTISAGSGTSTIRVLVNDGQGGFTPATPLLAGNGSSSLVAGQFTPDALLDLAVIDRDAGRVLILTGAANATLPFAAAAPLDVGPDPVRILAADLDGNGEANDLVVYHGTNGPAELTRLVRGLDGVLRAVAPLEYAVQPLLFEAALLDGDARADFIVRLPGPDGNTLDDLLAVAPSVLTAAQRVRLGNRAIAGDVHFGNQSLFNGAVRGTVFLDADGDGARDTGEAPLADVRITLDRNSNLVFDPGIDQIVFTDAEGRYSFENLTPGDYVVLVTTGTTDLLTFPPAGAYVIVMPPDVVFESRDFGIFRVPPPPPPPLSRLPLLTLHSAASGGDAARDFGFAVAAAGGDVLVGDPLQAGRVFLGLTTTIDAEAVGGVYRFDGETGALLLSSSPNFIPVIGPSAYSRDPNSARFGLGFSVSGLADGTIFAGAPFRADGVTGPNPPLLNQGSVYRLQPGMPIESLYDGFEDGGNGFAGTSLAQSHEQRFVYWGQPGSDSLTRYDRTPPARDDEFDLFGPNGGFPPDLFEPAAFGESVAVGQWGPEHVLYSLSHDGRRVLRIDLHTIYVGAPGADYLFNPVRPEEGRIGDTGAVTIHSSSGGNNLGPLALYAPQPSVGESFGAALAARGEQVLVGAPGREGAAYLFEVPPGFLPTEGVALPHDLFQARRTFRSPTPAIGDRFGFSVALVGDYVAIGAPRDDTVAPDAGAVYLFHAVTGQLLETFYSPDPREDGQFGFSLAMTEDGRLIVGAPDDGPGQTGAVYVFDVGYPDSDGDGVIDVVEAGAPGGGDGNNDGAPDDQQAHIVSLPDHYRLDFGPASDDYATLIAPQETHFTGVRLTPVSPAGVRPISDSRGYVQYTLHGVASLDTVAVQMILHSGRTTSGYFQFGPEPDRAATPTDESLPHWYDFRSLAGTGASRTGNVVTVSIVHGQTGDDLSNPEQLTVLGLLRGSVDTDGDGADDAEEDLAPNDGRGYLFSTPDRYVPTVASLVGTDRSIVTVVADSFLNSPLRQVQLTATRPPGAPSGAVFPVGLLTFAIDAHEAHVQMILHTRPFFHGYYQNGPATAPTWYDFAYQEERVGFHDVVTGAWYNDNVFHIEFIDGERGDFDGTRDCRIDPVTGGLVDCRLSGGFGGPVILPDGDGDGVPNLVEAGAPNGGDGNRDGIADQLQPHVASLFGAERSYATLVVPPGTHLSGTRVLIRAWDELDAFEAGLNFTFGRLEFVVESVTPGDPAELEVIVHAQRNPYGANVYSESYFDSYLYHGATAGDPAVHWEDFAFDTVTATGALVTGDSVTLRFRDGGRGDGDLAANGRIVNAGGWNISGDNDGDQIPNGAEDRAPGGDGNGDGVPDRDQGHVTTLLAGDGTYVTVVFPAGTDPHVQFEDATSRNPPAGATFPLGMLDFFGIDVPVGGAIDVEILLHGAEIAANTYYKLGFTPDNPTVHWYEFLFDGTTGAELINEDADPGIERIRLHFVDGLRGDNDRTANGRIHDPGGPAFIAPSEAFFVTGADAGGGPHVRVFDVVTLEERFSFFAYNPTFAGGVRVAMGDINGDGTPDIVTGAGPGGGPHVRVFDGVSGDPLPGDVGSFYAYHPRFTGGVFVASADVNGDGRDDIITGAGAGGGPHVKVFSGVDGAELLGFFAYDPGFTGGVSVAVGDVNGDGRADIITGAGSGGGPHVKVISGQDLSEVFSFFAYDPGFSGGVYVAAGDVNADGRADIFTGAGSGGGPHVRVFSGRNQAELHSFFAYNAAFTGGVRVAAGDFDGDGWGDIITGAGPGGGPHVKVFSGTSLAELTSNFAYDAKFTGGVFVASVGGTRSGPPPLSEQRELIHAAAIERWEDPLQDIRIGVADAAAQRMSKAPGIRRLSSTALIDELFARW